MVLPGARAHLRIRSSGDGGMVNYSDYSPIGCRADELNLCDLSFHPLIRSMPTTHHIILFYTYHPLSPDKNVTEKYRQALHTLCEKLEVQGRILVGCSTNEGINGTLSSEHVSRLLAFTYALMDPSIQRDTKDLSSMEHQAVQQFRSQSRAFFDLIQQPVLLMKSPNDFKWSTTTTTSDSAPIFPDLNIKLVSELIGTGGIMSSITLEETARGYLTPQEWHEAVREYQQQQTSNDTILIDCRNTKEHAIGHFTGSVDPQTTTFEQFPRWVKTHQSLLQHKKVLMFCTGGIRCEKASAYIRNTVPNVTSVQHLKGGIHKYLEAYGDQPDSTWQGRNFVFDGRGAATPKETRLGREGRKDVATVDTATYGMTNVVGSCIECAQPFDEFDPECICTVCREPTLVCFGCRALLREYHCVQHQTLKSCYFSCLDGYTDEELQSQRNSLVEALTDIAVGKKFRQKRKTLQKQISKIQAHIGSCSATQGPSCGDETRQSCRSCGDRGCSGRCWGFYSLKRKERLDQLQDRKTCTMPLVVPATSAHHVMTGKRTQLKRSRRELLAEELEQLQITSMLPSSHRDEITGVRVPPCCTRLLQCSVKGKWCGRSILHVLEQEFPQLSTLHLSQILDSGLVRVNDQTVPSVAKAADWQVKSSDRLARITHWHEAPVCLPEATIFVQKTTLPRVVIDEYNLGCSEVSIYACNKPSSVPVHPAGPYLANSLTVMIEAQENLPTQTLNPLHRTDRVTSGLALCSPNPSISRLFHACLEQKTVRKLYIARVKGKFPSQQGEVKRPASNLVSWSVDSNGVVMVDAPIHTVDPANGIRTIAAEGKPSRSLFRLASYDAETDTSLVSCSPQTGRSHQLRKHLQVLGHSIVGDVQYGSLEESSGEKPLYEAVQRQMTEAMHSQHETRLQCLSVEDTNVAKRVCLCCQEGVPRSFTAAQLLRGGHSIDLHSLRYELSIFPRKGRKNSATVSATRPLAVLEFSVPLPDWARSLEDLHLTWLSSQN